jgi:DNA mismatch endonuclease (patch repair protein)
MTDVLTPEQRRRCMAAIRGRNTRPELLVRSMVHRMGHRYRLHSRALPGQPDLVFPSKKKIIFVHGCFWHMHRCRYGRVRPRTNTEFWDSKRRANAARDKRNSAALRAAGWRVLVVWECSTRNPETLIKRLADFL